MVEFLTSVACAYVFWKFHGGIQIWMFPKIEVFPPKWSVQIMEHLIKMDDLGVPLFLETPI